MHQASSAPSNSTSGTDSQQHPQSKVPALVKQLRGPVPTTISSARPDHPITLEIVKQQLVSLNLHLKPADQQEKDSRVNTIRQLLLTLLHHDQAAELTEVLSQCFAAGIDILSEVVDVNRSWSDLEDGNSFLYQAYSLNAIECAKVLYRAGHEPLTKREFERLGLFCREGKYHNLREWMKLTLYYQANLADDTEAKIIDSLFDYQEQWGDYDPQSYSTKRPDYFVYQPSAGSANPVADAKDDNSYFANLSAEQTRQIADSIVDVSQHLLIYGRTLKHGFFKYPSAELSRFAFLLDCASNILKGTKLKLPILQKTIQVKGTSGTETSDIKFLALIFLQANLPQEDYELFVEDLKKYLAHDATIMATYERHRRLAKHEVDAATEVCTQIRKNPSHTYVGKKDDASIAIAAHQASALKVTAALTAAAEAYKINHEDSFAAISDDVISQRIRDVSVAVNQGPQPTTATVFAVLNAPRKNPAVTCKSSAKVDADAKQDDSTASAALVDSSATTAVATTKSAKAFDKHFPVKIRAPQRSGLFSLPVCRVADIGCSVSSSQPPAHGSTPGASLSNDSL